MSCCDAPKFIQIRDRGTNIPAMAQNITVKMAISVWEHAIIRRGGYGQDICILLTNIQRPVCQYDPAEWKDRTMQTAHAWILRHWDEVRSGDVVDVEHILMEVTQPKEFEV